MVSLSRDPSINLGSSSVRENGSVDSMSQPRRSARVAAQCERSVRRAESVSIPLDDDIDSLVPATFCCSSQAVCPFCRSPISDAAGLDAVQSCAECGFQVEDDAPVFRGCPLDSSRVCSW